MTKEDLYELIEKRKLVLEEKLEKGDPDFDRLKEIVENHNFYQAEDLIKLDFVELFHLILKFENPDSYDYYMKNFDGKGEKLIRASKATDIYQTSSSRFDYLYSIAVCYQIAAKKYLEVNKGTPEELAERFFVDERDFENLFGEYKSYKAEYDVLQSGYDLKEAASEVQWLGKLAMFQKGTVSAYDFFVLLYGYIESYNNLMLAKESKYKGVLKELELINISISGVMDSDMPDDIESVVSDYMDIEVENVLKKMKRSFHIETIIPSFMKFYNSALQKRKNFLKNAKRQINKYDSFKVRFESDLAKNEVVDADKLVDGLDEDIKKAVLGIIYEHNKSFYDEQSIEYQSLQQNQVLQIQLLLKDYGIEPGTYIVSDIMRGSFASIKSFLDKLKEINIVDADLLVNILKFGNIKAINDSYKYIKRSIISTEFLKGNIEFFDPTSDVYGNAMNNILTFLDNSFSLNYISGNQDVLLIENSLLIDNLNTIKQYGLGNGLSADVNCKLFKQENLAELFDVIIELGYEDRLKNDLGIASYDRNRWKRVELLKQLDVVIDDSELDTVLESDSFFVADDKIDSYIFRPFEGMINESNLIGKSNNGLEMLQQYSATPLTYDINGVVISKNRVNRNFSLLNGVSITEEEKIFVSLLCDRSMSKNEYDKVASIFEIDGQKFLCKMKNN